MDHGQSANFRHEKQKLVAQMALPVTTTRTIARDLQAFSALTDGELRRLWRVCAMPDAFALVAVGGYGRGDLFPFSDVDVLVLLPETANLDDDEPLKTALGSFISGCWDAGLEIGSSVRTVQACIEEALKDVTVQTALLESRPIAGCPALHKRFEVAFTTCLDHQAFFVAKSLELRQRHAKFENTPYSLEPNCKESPGGLRDLQAVLWVAKAAGMGTSWDALAKNGLATNFEIKQLKANLATLSLIRARLHATAGRREDRLVFDLQTQVAETFGYVGHKGKRASEQLMRSYYWAAKAVTQLNQILMLNIEERLNPQTHEPRAINERFLDKAGMLEVARDDLYETDPQAILETFLLYQNTVGIKGLSARTLRALYNARKLMDARFRHDSRNRVQFLQILQRPDGLTHALRLMNQTSVLGRYLWAFRRIVGQMQHDLFHVYTVDQHILMVLRNVRRFFIAEHAHEYPLCSQLAAGWDKPWVLYLAALYHDIAKGRGGDHSDLGVLEVRNFCKQHGVAKEDAKLAEFLVREHLSMSRIAQKEDLSDPDVIASFAKRVGNVRNLTALYLLTVADIRGTSPKVWNAWKGKLLEDLFRYTARTLGGRAPDASAWVEYRKTEAIKLLSLAGMHHEVQKSLWATLDVGYFMRHDANDLAWHVRQLHEHVGTSATVVRARLSPAGEGLQVLVYTPDQSDLFARICGYFEQHSFSILDARVHTARTKVDPATGTAAGFALDTFQVVATTLSEHYREFIQMVEVQLARALVEQAPLPPSSKTRQSRRVKNFPFAPRVNLQPDEKAQRWLLNISASDRIGLLYAIARVLARHKVNLQLAKISTLGERVEDTFLIDGAELQHNKAQIAIETELLEAVSG